MELFRDFDETLDRIEIDPRPAAKRQRVRSSTNARETCRKRSQRR